MNDRHHNALKAQPNPFKDNVSITYHRSSPAETGDITIYDATGRAVKTFSLTMPFAPSSMHIYWDGTDFQGGELPAGMYFCIAQTRSSRVIIKVLKLN